MGEEYPRTQILLVRFRKKSQSPGCYCAQIFVLSSRVEPAAGPHSALFQPPPACSARRVGGRCPGPMSALCFSIAIHRERSAHTSV